MQPLDRWSALGQILLHLLIQELLLIRRAINRLSSSSAVTWKEATDITLVDLQFADPAPYCGPFRGLGMAQAHRDVEDDFRPFLRHGNRLAGVIDRIDVGQSILNDLLVCFGCAAVVGNVEGRGRVILDRNPEHEFPRGEFPEDLVLAQLANVAVFRVLEAVGACIGQARELEDLAFDGDLVSACDFKHRAAP